MSDDPHIAALWRQRTNRARAEGIAGLARTVLIPLVAALAVVPLVRPVFLGFLDLPRALWGESVQAMVLRAALVVIGWLALDVYSALLRGPHRAVLAHLPVDPAQVVRADLLRVAAARWWLVPGAALALSPIALHGAVAMWAWALVALAGAFALGLTASAAVHLGAVRIAEDPGWAGILDMVRGSNPRQQAAFIYAPGVVMIGAGLLVSRAAEGVAHAAAGETVGGLQLLLPWIGAVICAVGLPRLARAAWFRGAAVVSEIDARYATLADPLEERRVYLDWVVRFLPATVARHALNDLRHGWRTRRTAITGAWMASLVAFGAGWAPAAVGPTRAGVFVVLATFAVAVQGPLLDRDVTPFLRHWLPAAGLDAAAARLLVSMLWCAPMAVLGALSVALRASLVQGLWILGVGAAAAAVAATLGWLSRGSIAVYGPAATVVAVAFAAIVGAS